MTLKVDPAFICSDSDTLHLCGECADLFIERARAVAAEFSAEQFSVQVSGFPPSVSLSMTWANEDRHTWLKK